MNDTRTAATDFAAEYRARHTVSPTAYTLCDLIHVAMLAFENESTTIPMRNRGIDGTLQMAAKTSEKLIDLIEKLERKLPDDVVREILEEADAA
ncbi:hypothetical protein [Tropicimonas sp. IMCC6043]|uniref:hypothetical protein n=1 Tax=Tropicimonas sp. IMCC6043 TaxID=2510645 RepID=UPI00101BFA2F|nr:hypothetical protein [Tropicimonas sp. IMCC6043]RYH12411.1 hypothetical protein EU800_02315 [Tropicimonas sp. IMCC6043]